MQILKGNNIKLRALEPDDVDILYQWENNTDVWPVSNTVTPISKHVLEQYLETAQYDIYATRQLRLIILNNDDKIVGCIDLFDFDPNNRRAGIGVLIADGSDRKKGYAGEALELLINYCFTTLGLHQLYSNVICDNQSSLGLFKKFGFKEVGIKKQWVRGSDAWLDEYLLQLINEAV